jgi:hypothetical protein
MFEDSLSQGGWIDSLRDNPPLAFVYLGGIPFAIFWIFYPSLWSGFAMQAYLITAFVFVLDPFANEKSNLKKPWFWKVMFTRGILLHLLLVGGLWCLMRSFLFLSLEQVLSSSWQSWSVGWKLLTFVLSWIGLDPKRRDCQQVSPDNRGYRKLVPT